MPAAHRDPPPARASVWEDEWGVRFGDDWGQQQGLIMGPVLWRRCIKPRIRKVYEMVRAAGRTVFIHCCGKVDEIMPDVVEPPVVLARGVPRPHIGSMKILYVRGMWGMDRPGLNANLDAIREGGFDAVEMGVPVDASERRALRSALERTGLALIAQQWTAGRTPEDHARSFEEQYRRAVELAPRFVNSHTGRDTFSLDQNLVVFRAAARLERETGVSVLHETHRGRALFSAPAASALLDALPGIRLTADFSHWCCVHESLLEDQADVIRKAVEASWHIHARVGHRQGPQVTHPGAPEWTEALEAHVSWWKQIAERHRQRGTAELTVCPEFGPVPYMPTLPWTRQPVADLWEMNVFMKALLKERLG